VSELPQALAAVPVNGERTSVTEHRSPTDGADSRRGGADHDAIDVDCLKFAFVAIEPKG
jgi:hypothetical protein